MKKGRKKKKASEGTKHIKLCRKVSKEDYAMMLAWSGGKCAICGNEPIGTKRLVVDHNHTTGNIRGLLCHYCNLGIGLFKDNINSLARAIVYLRTRDNPDYGK